MLKNKLAISMVVGITLSGCGSSEPEVTDIADKEVRFINVSGKAIDGYILGGTVFLDINGNGKAEPNEPQKLTEENGDYNLDVPEAEAECLAYSALIVDVPVGAIDEGSEAEGIERHEVTEPYQIILQPTFEPVTEVDFTNGLVRNISPLTTVVWEAIERNYPRKLNEKHCNYLKQHNDQVTKLQNEIEDTVRGLVQFYNLSADQMYADFIADKDSESFHVAQDIMKGLKAAYKHKSELRKIHPDAELRVFIYKSSEKDQEFNVEDGWYRDEIIFLGTEDFIEYVKLKDTGNLNVIDFVTSKFHELGQEWNDQEKGGWLSIREDTYRDADGTYRCGNIERVSFDVDGIHYELGNTVPTISYNSIDECINDNFSNPYERNYSLRYSENNVDYISEFYFRAEQTRFTDLADWKAFETESELVAQDMIDILSTMPYSWEAEVTIDTSYWRKRKTDGNVVIDTDNENNWRKSTKQEDGTTLYECGTDGESWTPCVD